MKRRELLGMMAAAGMALPLVRPGTLLAQEADPYLRFVHPDLRAAAAAILRMRGVMPSVGPNSLPAARASMERFAGPVRPDVPVEARTIPRTIGGGEIAVHVINARAGAARGAILHTHGGGFVSGTARAGIRGLQDLCAELDCLAVTVEYRLAPETTWSGSLEDNYAALKWLHANAAALGADPARIAVMGESAGGGHAAMLALAARDRGEVPLAFQCLIYPMLDDRTGSTRPVASQVGQLIWTAENNRFGWQSFLGMAPGGRGVPAAAVPARRADLAGLPPAFIGVGGIDLFVDEDIEYARRLTDAGVATELLVVPGAFHGFDGIAASTPIARWFNTAKTDALRRALAGPSS